MKVSDSQLAHPVFFSIIIPVYGAEKFLHKCIDSVLSQTYSNFELILVEDGSPDNCPQICEEYAQHDNRVRVIHKSNGGAASARNVGIRAAYGDYIMFTDSDDYWNDSTALQSILEAIVAYQCDVLCTNLFKTYIGEQIKKKYFAPSAPLVGIESVLLGERYISSPCSKIIKSQCFLNGQLDFVENVGSEDVDWSLRVALRSKKMVYIDLPFYCYLQRDTSLSHSMTIKKLHDLKSNVLVCIQLLSSQNQTMQRKLMPYVGFQYAILLLNIASLADKHQQAMFLTGLQKECHLLQFSNSSKVKMMNAANKLLGFQGMVHLLSFYVKITKRGIICRS